jgi:hypothetical protein
MRLHNSRLDGSTYAYIDDTQEWTGMDRIGQEQTGLFDHLQNKKTNFG